MFRAEMKAETELGKMASSILASGGLVGDEIVNGIVASRISRPDCTGGFLLDGYPRTVPQAMFFSALLQERGLPEPAVIHLDVPDSALVARLTARRQCSKCLRIYNMLSQPPKQEGICDDDGAELLSRADDQEAVIRQRLEAYHELTGPILKWFGPSKCHVIDGTKPTAQVSLALEQLLLGLPNGVAVA